MATFSDHVGAAFIKLKWQLDQIFFDSMDEDEQSREEILGTVNFITNNFEEKLKFVSMFVDCVHEWSDADEVVPELGSLIIKIEVAGKGIANLLENIPRFEAEYSIKSLMLKSLSPKLWRETQLQCLQKWAWRVTDVLNSTNIMIELLIQEIFRFYESHSLPSQSLQFKSPMLDFGRWKYFLLYIQQNLHALMGSTLSEESRVYASKMEVMTDIQELLLESSPENLRLEVLMIQAGSVGVRAALVSCEFWVSSRDSNMQNTLNTNLQNLQLVIDYLIAESVDMYLRVLKTFQPPILVEVGRFVERFLNHRGPYPLYQELKALIDYVINPPQKYTAPEDELRFLADVKALIMEAVCLSHLFVELADDRIMHDLLIKICHVKIEIFLCTLLATTGDTFQLSLDDQIYALTCGVEDLTFKKVSTALTRCLGDPPSGSIGNGKGILMLMEEVASEVPFLIHSFHAEEITSKMVRNAQLEMLVKIVLFKAESFFMEMSNISESLRDPIQDRIKSLHEELKFLLESFVEYQPQGVVLQDAKLIFTHFQAMAKGLILLCHSSRTNKITEELVKNMNVTLCDLLDEHKLIMVYFREKYVHIPSSRAPKTNGLGFIDSFLRRLTVLLNDKADLFASVKDQIEELLAYLELLRSFLRDILEQGTEVKELKYLGSRVIDLSYEAEYLVDLIVQENAVAWRHSLWLYQLLKDTRLVKMQLNTIYEKKPDYVRVHNATQPPRPKISKLVTPTTDDFVVDLNDEEELITNLLIGGFLQRDIVLIFGMAGIGKTTMAKKVYNSPEIKPHFHIRAWCCISQTYTKRELLLEILGHITTLTDDILGMTVGDLEFKLYKLLMAKKYLIVMDDMWNSEAWDDMEKSFPCDGNGSRILVTSRLHDVLQGKVETHAHALRSLSEDESWALIQKKIFHEEGCPEQLMEAGKQIAKNCRGLPLSVVAMAGLLQGIDRRQDQWKHISESVSSRILDNQETRCMGILELSYKHLPENLKACFLYFGAFLEEENIPAKKLIRLYIAEGFVEEIELLKNLEDLAENYLMDLIGRSLVIVAKKRSNGRIKACRVHDMLRNFCLSKAKEENFFQLIAGNDEDCTSFDGLDYGVDSDYAYSSHPITYEDHRVCIRSKRKNFVMSRPSGPRVRSLLLFPGSDMYPRCPYTISFIPHNFKLLKVLDLECINMGASFPDGVELLVHLRYLAVSGDIDSVPSSICHLRNLETFTVEGLKGKVKLPDTIWFMARLRHVHVRNSVVFSLEDDLLGNSLQLHDLITLSSPILSYGESSNEILRRLPNLEKLRCILLESRKSSTDHDLFPELDALTKLESLKISYHGRAFSSVKFMFPSNVKRLTLSNFRLPWDQISAIGNLPNLEVLKLLSRAFEGETWDMTEGEFSKLKFLKLDSLNIATWNASSDHLPSLQHLVLQCCMDLQEVPSSFAEINTLQMIQVQWCGKFAEESARKIEEEVEGLKVSILSDLLRS